MLSISTLVLGTALLAPTAPFPQGLEGTARAPGDAPPVAAPVESSQLRDPFIGHEPDAAAGSGRRLWTQSDRDLVDPFGVEPRSPSKAKPLRSRAELPDPFDVETSDNRPIAKRANLPDPFAT